MVTTVVGTTATTVGEDGGAVEDSDGGVWRGDVTRQSCGVVETEAEGRPRGEKWED